QVGGDPQTPVFVAKVGSQVRMRVLMPGGNQRNHVFQVHGHVWEQEPFGHDPDKPLEARYGSTRFLPNPPSQWEGAEMGVGPGSPVNAVLKHGAGGAFAVPGDYLWRDHASFSFDAGIWGILRVEP